jgi:hypothetical protein
VAEHPTSTLLSDFAAVLAQVTAGQESLVKALRTIRTEGFGIEAHDARTDGGKGNGLDPSGTVGTSLPAFDLAAAQHGGSTGHSTLPAPANITTAGTLRSGARDYDFFSELDERLARLASGDGVHPNGHSNN